ARRPRSTSVAGCARCAASVAIRSPSRHGSCARMRAVACAARSMRGWTCSPWPTRPTTNAPASSVLPARASPGCCRDARLPRCRQRPGAGLLAGQRVPVDAKAVRRGARRRPRTRSATCCRHRRPALDRSARRRRGRGRSADHRRLPALHRRKPSRPRGDDGRGNPRARQRTDRRDQRGLRPGDAVHQALIPSRVQIGVQHRSRTACLHARRRRFHIGRRAHTAGAVTMARPVDAPPVPHATGPLLTRDVADALCAARDAGPGTWAGSPDLGRSTTPATLAATHWRWRDREFPYPGSLKDRSIHYWDGEAFVAASRYGRALYKLVPTAWGAPTFEIDGIKMLQTAKVSPFEDARSKVALIDPRGRRVLDTCGGLGYFAAGCLEAGAADILSFEKSEDVLWLRTLNPWSPDPDAPEHGGRLQLRQGDVSQEIARLPDAG